MTWIMPKTDWTDNDRVRPFDLNRIFGNLNHLAGTELKDDYTKNDFLTAASWDALVSELRRLELATRAAANAAETQLEAAPGNEMTAAAFNNAEACLQMLYERLEYLFRQQKAVTYAGDPIYASELPDALTRGR